VDLATLTAIRRELEAELIGGRFGKIFQLSALGLAIDFRLPGSGYLFISIEPRNPRVYLIRRKLRELEKASGNPTPFALVLRKRLSGAELSSITQIEDDRILLFNFEATDDREEHVTYSLVAQLTGASSNLFLLDGESVIVDAARETRGDGQQPGDRYQSPPTRSSGDAATLDVRDGELSAYLDAENVAKAKEKEFQSLVAKARNKIKQAITKHEKLARKLEQDLINHGDPEKWKRFGDLLLANVGTARRDGENILVTDYFDEAAPEIAVAIDENDSITEAAEKFFRRYTKARNARDEIARRMKEIGDELSSLATRTADLEDAIAARDVERISEFAGEQKQTASRNEKRREAAQSSGARSFISSDGFEILVGKKAKDNDFLTFRIAKSLDTWMHAADYPGSHVVVRNPNRKEIPHRTLLEAAQLAAFYSQGKSQLKAAVHYTQKKFVNKPKGAAPGLVSLASFKTLLVEPVIGEVKRKV
jgi:predicted ribosome quality control (RQC) complex YloA/Tae2 family protein